MRKIPPGVENLEIFGLPWFEHNNQQLWRLPYELEHRLGKALWENSQRPTGGRIRFRSNTSLLGVLADYNGLQHVCGNPACRIGRMGIDLYTDGQFWSCVYPQREGENEAIFFENVDKEWRDFTLYLPLLHRLDIKKILVDDEAAILPPEPYALTKPVVFYGTSVTQGACASRSGLSYQAMISRELNLDYVSLGFAGLGRGEAALAKVIADMDAVCYVLDYAQNNLHVRELEQVYRPFLSVIREKNPSTPIILTTPISYRAELWDLETRQTLEERRKVIRNVFHEFVTAGDKHLYLIEGSELIPPDYGDGQVDGAHPNDLGFYKISQALQKVLRTILFPQDYR